MAGGGYQPLLTKEASALGQLVVDARTLVLATGQPRGEHPSYSVRASNKRGL